MKKISKFTSNKKSPLQKKEERKRLRPKISLADIYNLCKRNISLSDIAKKIGISPISTATYIERLLRKGYEVNIIIERILKCLGLKQLKNSILI